MKILLVGEFSRLHNSLKEALVQLGHDVLLVGEGDNFKGYPVDETLEITFFNKRIPLLLRKIVHKLIRFDIADFEKAKKFKTILPKLKDYDIVQLINEDALLMHPKIQIPFLKQLFKQNKKVFLLSSGDDFITIEHYLKKKERYSVLTPYLNNPKLKKKYAFSLKYTKRSYMNLHAFVYSHIEGVIATDIDYHLPLKNHTQYLGMIPNPVNIDKIEYNPPKIEEKIYIFHGINKLSYTKKGSDIIEKALGTIINKYPDKVEIKTVCSIPYKEYIKSYESAHIIMDQTYGYDQGYNALEAMAKGKVVFTGAEKEWLDHFNLEEDTVVINAEPSSKKIEEKLEWLIKNPTKIQQISFNARKFIEKEHNHLSIGKKYLEKWMNSI